MPKQPLFGYRPIDQELVRSWTKQLYQEFDYVQFLYKTKLRPPVIRIQALKSRWGSWDAGSRTIAISSALIQDHPWDIVVEILKHEMAHQLVSETLLEGKPHGPHFSHACELLKVAEWARSAGGDIPRDFARWRNVVVSEKEERLLNRVEKLLALARSNNEHEALLAMQRVQEIYARHNLSRLKTHTKATVISLVINLHRQRIHREISMICSILSGHFFVRIIFGRLYHAHDLAEYRSVELIGARENVLMAEYVYHFLKEQVEALWREYRKKSCITGRAKRDYVLGILAGFEQKLSLGKETIITNAAKAAELASQETNALIRLGDMELEHFVQQRYPRLKTRHWNSGYRDRQSYSDGMEAGQNMVLNKGITQSNTRRGILLTDR